MRNRSSYPDDSALIDILDAAQRILKYTEGVNFEEFCESELHKSLSIHNLLVIGEAATRISDELKNAHSEIPWRSMIALRNRLIHQYHLVDYSLVFQLVKEEIPTLVKQLEILLD